MSVRFWGVRGSLATPGRSTSKYGGNTACVEVIAGDERIIFDMGSGLRELGAALVGQGSQRATFFLSHYHWDHILGLPFFAPAYDQDAELTIHGATRLGKSVREILAGQMINPYFPVSLGEMRAALNFRGIESGSTVVVGPAIVHARELCHPGGALGFRVDAFGKSVVYATDFEHGTPADGVLEELAQGADLLIFDATYTPHEYRTGKKGWGHSTWAEGARIAKAAGCRKLVLFHHDPAHDDATIDAIVKDARKKFPATDGAREGKAYELLKLSTTRTLEPARRPTRRPTVAAAARTSSRPPRPRKSR